MLLRRLFPGICLLMVILQLSAQDIQKPVARQLNFIRESSVEVPVDLFQKNRDVQPDMSAHVRSAEYLHLSDEAVATVRALRPELLSFEIPGNTMDVVLELYRVEIFSEQYMLRTSDGIKYPRSGRALFYRGIVRGDQTSLATVSFLDHEVRVMYATPKGNYRIHQVKDAQYVYYADKDVYQTESYSCGTTDQYQIGTPDENVRQRTVLTGNCVEVYFECDYKSYQDNGNSVTNTENWISALFNEVATIYENEDIPVFISDIMVWTSTDPYAGLNSTSALLNEFIAQTTLNEYDGRLAHLVSTRPLGGGIAYIDVLCHNTLACAVSTSLNTNIVQFPAYSWNVNCVSHEMGHNFGSWHTHNCVWNGNNTQIDDCGSEYGDEQQCYDEDNPILPVDGTIMSYCHLVGVGVNFTLGFGTQPGNLIRNEYNNASCNTGTCTPPACTNLTNPMHLQQNIDINSNVSWAASSGATGYRLTMGTSPGSGNIVNNLDVGLVTTYDPTNAFPYNQNIYVKVVPYNGAGNSTGCSEQNFKTELNVAPACTELTAPLDGATNVSVNANLFWTHSVGAQTGYKLRIGTTPSGGEILNNVNVGNVTTYDPPNAFPGNTTIYVKITPVWSGGDITTCAVESFTTADPVYCASAGISQEDEWIAGVSVAGFTNTSGPDDYSNFTNLIADVSAGATHPVSITAGYAGQQFGEYFRVWIDLNHDGTFAEPGERVFQANVAGTATGNITIPASAYIGTTRMRISMRWGNYSTPCQQFNFGEVEDYTVRIHCNYVSNTSNSGVGSLAWAVGCVSNNETITFAPALNGQTINLTSSQLIIDSPMTIMTNPANNITVYGETIQRVFTVNSGVTAKIEGLKIIAGTAVEGGAIQNSGTLTIDDLKLYKHPGMTNVRLIRTLGGMLKIQGACILD